MRRTLPALTLATALSLTLAACGGGGSQSQDSGSSPAAAAASPSENGPSLASAPASFAQCTSCHTIKQGLNAVGPSLFGVVGRKAGSLAGYSYSDALKNSGKTWDEASLDAWIAAPMKDVPGTKMTFAGVTDAAKRKEIIDFLKTVK